MDIMDELKTDHLPVKILLAGVSREEDHSYLHMANYFPFWQQDTALVGDFLLEHDIVVKFISRDRWILKFEGEDNFDDIFEHFEFLSPLDSKSHKYNLHHRRVHNLDIFELEIKSPYTCQYILDKLGITEGKITVKLPEFAKEEYLDSGLCDTEEAEQEECIELENLSETIERFYDLIPKIEYIKLIDENDLETIILLDEHKIWIFPKDWERMKEELIGPG